MKQRMGFVSNSSSSSFIVSGKKGSKPTVVVEMELPVDETISSLKELEAYFIERYGYDDADTIEKLFKQDEYLKESYDECVKELKKGNCIFVGNVANDDGDSISQFLYDNGIDNTLKNGKVICDCQG